MKKLIYDKSKNIQKIIFIIICVSISIYVYKVEKLISDYPGRIQAITNLSVIMSAIFVGYQAYMIKKDYSIKNQKHEAEKAIQLAELYANEMISKMGYLFFIYETLGIMEIVNEIKNSDIYEFDKEELDCLISKEKQKFIAQKLANIDVKILLAARRFLLKHGSEDFLKNISNFVLPIINDDEEATLKITKEILNNEFSTIKSETLNKLEYFSMYFNSGIANDAAVYQSLHQTYIANAKTLYYDIARKNISGKDKLYTNIINLYNKWNKMYEIAYQKEVQDRRSYAHKGMCVKS